jgi:hypothetical protein
MQRRVVAGAIAIKPLCIGGVSRGCYIVVLIRPVLVLVRCRCGSIGAE